MEDLQEKKVNIFDYMFIIARSWRFILINLLGLTIIATIVSLSLPKVYRGEAVILPPVERKQAFGFSDILAAIPVTTLRLGAKGSPSEIYQGILRSNSIRRQMLEHFNLLDDYKVDTVDEALEILKNNTEVALTEEGLIRVRVEDKDAVQCAEMANYYIHLLDRTNQLINQRLAKDRLLFIEKQMDEAAKVLAESESKLIAFQKETNAISIYHQQRVAISVSAELEMEIMNMEMSLEELMDKSLTLEHPQIRDIFRKIDFRRKQLKEMQFGRVEGGLIERESLFVPLARAPVMTLQYARYENEVEVIGILIQLLSQQASESKIESENTTITVSPLDEAHTPQIKYKPKRKLIILISAAFSLFLSMAIIISVEYLHRLGETYAIDREKIRRLEHFLHLDR